MYELHNHTPHRVVIEIDGATPAVLEPVPPIARIAVTRQASGTLPTVHGAIPLTATSLASCALDLPAPRPGVRLVVARAVVEAEPARSDLLFPDNLVRDDDGRVVACRALGQGGISS